MSQLTEYLFPAKEGASAKTEFDFVQYSVFCDSHDSSSEFIDVHLLISRWFTNLKRFCYNQEVHLRG